MTEEMVLSLTETLAKIPQSVKVFNDCMLRLVQSFINLCRYCIQMSYFCASDHYIYLLIYAFGALIDP